MDLTADEFLDNNCETRICALYDHMQTLIEDAAMRAKFNEIYDFIMAQLHMHVELAYSVVTVFAQDIAAKCKKHDAELERIASDNYINFESLTGNVILESVCVLAKFYHEEFIEIVHHDLRPDLLKYALQNELHWRENCEALIKATTQTIEQEFIDTLSDEKKTFITAHEDSIYIV